MLNATVVNRIDRTPELLVLQVLPDGGVPDFIPGQYVALGLPGAAARYPGAAPEEQPPAPDKLIKRAYSISSTPNQRGYLEFYIAVVPSGALTSRIAALQPGDRIFTQAKVTGHFTLDGVPDDHNLVLVSTGTGLAPYMSMVRSAETWTATRRITVVHGVRYPSDLTFSEELRGLEELWGERFKYVPIASRAGDEWAGARGRVQSLFDESTITVDPGSDRVFLCGNPAMIEEVESLLGGRGYTVHSKKNPGNLHVEKYW